MYSSHISFVPFFFVPFVFQPTPEMHRQSGFAALIDDVERKMAE